MVVRCTVDQTSVCVSRVTGRLARLVEDCGSTSTATVVSCPTDTCPTFTINLGNPGAHRLHGWLSDVAARCERFVD
jgi:hypothetical protein